MKKSRLMGGICSLLLCFSAPSHAITVLFFDGVVTYDPGMGVIEVTAELTSTIGIDPPPNTVGSSVSFEAALFSVFNTFDGVDIITTSVFLGVPGNDLTVIDGDANTLLTGNFSSLEISGANKNPVTLGNQGSGTGVVSATGGDLSGVFGTSPIAFELSLDTLFELTMYDNSFSGDVSGHIGVVPVPAAVWLFGSGLLGLIGITRRKKAA